MRFECFQNFGTPKFFPEADWEFIKGLLQFVIYGGRIENSFDNCVLESYLETLFTDVRICGREGQTVGAGRVPIPAADRMDAYMAIVLKEVPSEDDPILFGLPANIRYSWQLTESEDTLARLRFEGSFLAFKSINNSFKSINNFI